MRASEVQRLLHQHNEQLREQLKVREIEVERLNQRLEDQQRFYLDRIRELEDSTRALSLDQLRGMHPTVAMQATEPEPIRKLYAHDVTGLIAIEVDPRDHEPE